MKQLLDAKTLTLDQQASLYQESSIATKEVGSWIHKEGKAHNLKLCKRYKKPSDLVIGVWPVVARQLARYRSPAIVVPAEIQESLSVAIQTRKKRLELETTLDDSHERHNSDFSFLEEDYHERHESAISFLEDVRDALEPYFSHTPEDNLACGGFLDGMMSAITTHQPDPTSDHGVNQSPVQENGTTSLLLFHFSTSLLSIFTALEHLLTSFQPLHRPFRPVYHFILRRTF